MIINKEDYYIVSFGTARKHLLDFFTSIDGTCRLQREEIENGNEKTHNYTINGDEIIFSLDGKLIEIDDKGEWHLAEENTSSFNRYMAIPKEVFFDTERFITILDFSQRNRVLKMHIMKTSLPVVMDSLRYVEKEFYAISEIKEQIAKSQKIITDEKQKIKFLKKKLASIKEKEAMEK